MAPASLICAKPSCGDDFRRALTGFEHGREHFFPAGGGDFAALHFLEQLRERGRPDRAVADVLADVVQAAQQFDRDPIRGCFRRSAGAHRRFEVIGQRSRRREDRPRRRA